jgi:hypothetical protein
MRTRTKARLAGKTAKAMVEHPTLRKAAMTAGPPVVKVRFGIARRRARRRALERAAQVQNAARVAQDTLAAYGPQAAEALGLTERPKPRRAPSIAFGAVLGASAVYFLEPGQGAARRTKLVALLDSRQPQPSASPSEM